MKITFEELPKKTQNYLVLDCDSVAHRAYYAFTRKDYARRTADGILSGCFYGFFLQLLKQMKDVAPAEIALCWGDKRDNLLRRKIYPQYKIHRGDKPEGLDDQILDIKKTLFSMGFSQVCSFGYEGDDVVAVKVKFYKKLKQPLPEKVDSKIYIVSNDKDMRQLIDKDVVVIEMTSGYKTSDIYHNEDTVFKFFGVKPELLADYLTLIGDSSDNIPGVRGIGPTTAADLLNTNGPIYDWFDKIPEIQATDNIKNKLLINRSQMCLSKSLISLKEVDIPLQSIIFPTKDIFTVLTPPMIEPSPDFYFDKYGIEYPRPYEFLFLEDS